MNHVYRLVWSALLNAWLCVAEVARSKGKSRSGKANTTLMPLALPAAASLAQATITFTLAPANAALSSSGNTSVGNYAIQDGNPVIGGGNLSGPVTFTGKQAGDGRPTTSPNKGHSGTVKAPARPRSTLP